MRNRTCVLRLFLFILFCYGVTLQAQTVSKEFREQTLKSVLQEVEHQTGLSVIYKTDEVNEQKKITAVFVDSPLAEVLTEILDPSLEYKLQNKMIVISRRATRSGGDQVKNISGTIVDERGEPIIGASILVKGTSIGAITNLDGNYSLLNVPGSGVILISYVGYKPQTLQAKDNLSRIILVEDSKLIDEVVVVGYGTQSKARVTGSISRMSGEVIGKLAVSSFDEAMTGRIAGVDISQTSGAPGAGMSMKIRGNSSINYGGQPLIVVDGLPLSSTSYNSDMQGKSTVSNFSQSYSLNPLSTINPSDIESIDVLKDAASTAIYGSRGSNGVVIITTRKGKIGKPQVDVNIYGGVQVLDKKVDVMDAYELANFTKKSRDLAWTAVGGNADDPFDVRKGANYIYPTYMLPYINGQKGLVNTDWQNEVYRTAFQQNYDVNISGGTEKVRYYVSGNYLNQKGIIINSGIERFSSRINVEGEITNRLTFGVRFNASKKINNMVQSEGEWWKEGIVITALMYHPNLPARNADGSLALDGMLREKGLGNNIAAIQNPVALAEMLENKMEERQFIGNTFFDYKLMDGLHMRTSLGIESTGMHRTCYRPKSLSYNDEIAPTKNFNYGLDSNASIYNWISETSLTFNKDFGKHNFNGLVNFSVQKEKNKLALIEGRNYPNDNVTTLNGASVTTGTSEMNEAAMVSFLGRVMYAYGSKYMFSASIRRDGSSRFAANNKWGWFPSVSGGWNISQEKFFPKSKIVSDLKLRLSYGMTGNAEIPFYGGIPILKNSNYIFGNNTSLGFSPSTAPNKDLSWESTSTVNIGLDGGLFNNNIQYSIDAYQSTTTDLLLNVTIPATSGLTSALQNIGKIRNRGLEISLSTVQELTKDWSVNAALSFATNANKVLALGPGQSQLLYSSGLSDPSFIVKVGEPIGSFYGYKVAGIFANQHQFDNTPHLENAGQGVGDFIYEDTNGDKKVNNDDRVVLGNANPDFTWGFNGGFNWKNLDFSFNLQGKHGQEVFNAMHRYLAEAWGNNLAVYQSENAPRPVWGVATRSHTRPSSWHVENASFIRIKSLTLGYTLNKIWKMNRLRVYASANNLHTFTRYSGYNPEVSNKGNNAIMAGEDFGNYPVAKSFTFGVNLSF